MKVFKIEPHKINNDAELQESLGVYIIEADSFGEAVEKLIIHLGYDGYSIAADCASIIVMIDDNHGINFGYE